MPTHAGGQPAGVEIGTDSKRCCATQLSGLTRTPIRAFSHSPGRIHSRTLIVSPVLHIAVFKSQPSSRDHGASRGSRVSGSKARHAGNAVESFSQVSGKRLLSEITAKAGLATRVFPPRDNCRQPYFSGSRESHSAW